MKQLLDADGHRGVTQAVRRAEQGTDGEIVTIVAARSDHYLDVAFCVSALVALLVLALAAMFPGVVSTLVASLSPAWGAGPAPADHLVVVSALATVLAAGVLALLVFTPLRTRLVPARLREQRVAERAQAMFLVGAERRTVGLTGILIYLSIAERRAEIVADAAIADKVDSAVWGDAMAALIEAVRDGRTADGMVAAVEQVGAVLKIHFPKSEGNRNELPDRLIEIE